MNNDVSFISLTGEMFLICYNERLYILLMKSIYDILKSYMI